MLLGFLRFAVAYPTKILFWKRITAKTGYNTLYYSCCLSYKDTILKANHSTLVITIWLIFAVAYPTKILFWKRITAFQRHKTGRFSLLLILQRYYFESESQPPHPCCPGYPRCCLSYKDTILKANHSLYGHGYSLQTAVAYPTKILFWKRITASVCVHFLFVVLLLILQRYYFESESQQTTCDIISLKGCCLSYKDTILKANHSWII